MNAYYSSHVARNYVRVTLGLKLPRFCWLIGIALSLGFVSIDRAADICRPGDTLWEVSSRGLPGCPQVDGVQHLEVLQLNQSCWSSQSLETLKQYVDQTQGQRLVIYVHGNWMPREDARLRARQVYQRLVTQVNCEPICFLAFSWPSERSEGFARDIIGKKTRLDADAYYLASMVQSLELRQPVGYLGYSFGSAVICGAHHLLAGGLLNGMELAELPAERYEDRISLVAPAFDRQSLTQCGQYNRALDSVEKLVNVYNSIDPILKRFRFFDRDTSPTAAGFAGILEPRNGTPLTADQRIEQFDCRAIGRTHAELDYLRCANLTIALKNVVGQ